MPTTLVTPVELAQHPDEFTPLLDLYVQAAPKRVLEVGVYYGGTLYHWLQSAPDDAHVVAIDDQHRNRDAYGQWLDRGIALTPITGDSHAAQTIAKAGEWAPYDFVFIDASHYLDDVRRDWLNYSAMTAAGAIVAFHDITPTPDPTVDVAPLWRELRDEYQSVELETQFGYGIGVLWMP